MAKATPKKQRKIRYWFRTNCLAFCSLIVATISGFGTLGYNVYRDHTSGRAIDEKMGRFETSLRILAQTAAPQIYKSIDDSLHAALIQDDSQAIKALAGASTIVTLLNNTKVQGDPEALARSGKIMAEVANAHPGLPETWQAAIQFVNYKYQLGPILSSSLPNCLDIALPGVEPAIDGITPPGPASAAVGSPDGSHYMSRIALSRCKLILDDKGVFYSTPVGKYLVEIKRQHPTLDVVELILEDVDIVYSGGKLFPVNRILFKNCTFQFKPSTELPSKGTQALTTQLLAESISEGSILLPGGM